MIASIVLFQNCGSGFESIEGLERDISGPESSNVELPEPINPEPQEEQIINVVEVPVNPSGEVTPL